MTRAVRIWIVSCLASLALGPAVVRAQDDLDLGDEVEAGDTALEEEAEGADTEAEDDSQPEDPEPSEASEPGADESAPPTAASVEVQAYAGAGATTRSLERPIDGGGTQRLQPSLVPAVEVGLRVVAWPAEAFSLAMEFRYQSAVGLTVSQVPPFALEESLSVRSERAEVSAAPSWRLGDSLDSARLLVPIGFQLRTLWPDVHGLRTRTEIVPPGYTLLGPHARLELWAVLAGPVTVRIGPEVQWIMGIDEAVQQNGLARMGVALGGEVALQVALNRTWAIALQYRESHAFMSGSPVSFEDVERYMTARMQGMF